MKIDILTLFPEMFNGVFDHSILKRAQDKKLIKIKLHNLRDWAQDKHKKVDDTTYGGGAGMVLKVDVIDRALHDLKTKKAKVKSKNKSDFIVMLTPQGKRYNQKIAQKLSKRSNLILICGHYEGFDERVRELVDEEVSIGDYVLTGGEIPAMVLCDSVARLIPGVLGKNESHQEESFSMENLNSKLILEYPQYTKPEKYLPISKKFKKSLNVPDILLSGNHAKIKDWRIQESIKKSKPVS